MGAFNRLGPLWGQSPSTLLGTGSRLPRPRSPGGEAPACIVQTLMPLAGRTAHHGIDLRPGHLCCCGNRHPPRSLHPQILAWPPALRLSVPIFPWFPGETLSVLLSPVPGCVRGLGILISQIP